MQVIDSNGADGQIRTGDLLITNQLPQITGPIAPCRKSFILLNCSSYVWRLTDPIAVNSVPAHNPGIPQGVLKKSGKLEAA